MAAQLEENPRLVMECVQALARGEDQGGFESVV